MLEFNQLKYIKLKTVTIFLSLIALNLIIKGMFLGANSLAVDEPFSVYHSQMNLSAIIQLLAQGNNPPLYEILLHFWVKLFGISEFSVRFPSLIFSTITVGFLFQIGQKFFNRRTAVLTCLIFIFSNFQITLAHESRTYTLLGMLTAISMFYYIKILQACNKSDLPIPKSNFIGLGFVNALLGYCHYFGFQVIIVQFLYTLIWFPVFRSQLKNIVVTIVVTFILYIPNIPTIFNRFHASAGGTWITPLDGINSLYYMLMYFSNAPLVAASIILIWVSAFIYYFTNKTKEINPLYGFIVFWFSSIFFGMYFVSFKTPIFLDRYLMPAAIAFPILIAIACNYIFAHKKWNSVFGIVMGVLFIATVNPVSSNQLEIRECVSKLKQLKNQNTVVYICPDWLDMNFAYYYNQNYFKDFNDQKIKKNIYRYLKAEQIYPIKNWKQINMSSLEKGKTIIFLDDASDYDYPNNQIKKQLEHHCQLKQSFAFKKNYILYKYEVF